MDVRSVTIHPNKPHGLSAVETGCKKQNTPSLGTHNAISHTASTLTACPFTGRLQHHHHRFDCINIQTQHAVPDKESQAWNRRPEVWHHPVFQHLSTLMYSQKQGRSLYSCPLMMAAHNALRVQPTICDSHRQTREGVETIRHLDN